MARSTVLFSSLLAESYARFAADYQKRPRRKAESPAPDPRPAAESVAFGFLPPKSEPPEAKPMCILDTGSIGCRQVSLTQIDHRITVLARPHHVFNLSLFGGIHQAL
jgi:hypothetical protein